VKTRYPNILTVDVEDWQQSTLDTNLPISGRVLRNTNRLLDLLAEFNVRATLFIQTQVAEVFPELIRRIAREGHEIGSHGHHHIPLFKLQPPDFSADLRRSLEILRAFTHHPVQGYRAPDFSLRQDTLWALDILRKEGIRYSSSIFPFHGRRYGMANAPVVAHWAADGLTEIPLSVFRFAGRNWPVAGGGYLRLMPYWATRWVIGKINQEGRPAVIYIHPYELDDQEVRGFRNQISWRFYWSQHLNRHRTETKLRLLFQEFTFAPIREVIML
jgi:polysaccharide deacetylase family protein (PEP-CTERM system associated)